METDLWFKECELGVDYSFGRVRSFPMWGLGHESQGKRLNERRKNR